jgi:hypothetical protein
MAFYRKKFTKYSRGNDLAITNQHRRQDAVLLKNKILKTSAMKKVLIGLTLLASLIASSSFSNYEDKLPGWLVQRAFRAEFTTATDIKWQEENQVAIATFILNHSTVQAFFDFDGTLLGTARFLKFDELPVLSITAISNRFPNAISYDPIEYTVNGELYYVLTVETTTRIFQVKVLPTGETVIRKSTKVVVANSR